MKTKIALVAIALISILTAFYFYNKKDLPKESSLHISTDLEYINNIIDDPPKLGFSFFHNQKEIYVNLLEPYDYKFNHSQPGFFNIQVNGKTYAIYMEPGDALNISFNKNEEGLLVAQIEGNNSDGHNYLANQHRPLFITESASLKAQYNTIESAQEGATQQLSQASKSIDSIYELGNISKNFRDAWKSEVNTYYTHVKLRILMDSLINLKVLSNRFVLPQDTSTFFLNNYKRLMQNYDLNDKTNIYSPSYLYFITEVIDFEYVFDSKNYKQRAFEDYGKTNEEYYLKGMKNLDLSPEANELTSALLLDYCVFQEKGNNKFLVGFWNDFKSQNPKSVYIPLFDRQIKKIEDLYKTDNNAIKIVENSDEINSVSTLLAKFKDQIVFVDIWATWCTPCKVEFEHNNALNVFAKSNNITKLFISIDKDELEPQWRDDMKYFNLEGYHLRANQELNADLMRYFGMNTTNGKALSIPHYFIIKNGQIVVANASRPSSKDLLFKQLKSYL